MLKKSLLVLSLVILVTLAAACTPAVQEPANGGENGLEIEGQIVIAGTDIGEKTILMSEIAAMPSVERSVVSVNSAGEENEFAVKGTLFEDVLDSIGLNQQDLDGVRLVAGDGYQMEVPKEILAARDIILAYEIDHEPLLEQTLPTRVIIPEERAMYWVRNVTRIEILEVRSEVSLAKLILLESAIESLEKHDYNYYESNDQAVLAKELFESQDIGVEVDTVFLKSVDGLERNETLDVFNEAYIKYTGEDSPVFLSPDMPAGMRVKELLFFAQGDVGILCLDKAISCFDIVEKADKEGIDLIQVFEEVSMEDGDSYLFTATDGYEIEITKEDISKGVLFIRDTGEMSVAFDGLPKNTSVRGLLSIEAVK